MKKLGIVLFIIGVAVFFFSMYMFIWTSNQYIPQVKNGDWKYEDWFVQMFFLAALMLISIGSRIGGFVIYVRHRND